MLGRSPIQHMFQKRALDTFPILAYHDVPDPTRFERHLDLLTSTHRPLSLDEVLDHLDRGEDLPRGTCLITFDDGDRTVLSHALPAMRQHRIPGVVFVASSLIGTLTPIWT